MGGRRDDARGGKRGVKEVASGGPAAPAVATGADVCCLELMVFDGIINFPMTVLHARQVRCFISWVWGDVTLSGS